MKTNIIIDFDSDRNNQIILSKGYDSLEPNIMTDIIGTCAALCELINYGLKNNLIDKEKTLSAILKTINDTTNEQ